MTAEPLLPPELERHIFLYALYNSRKDAQNLLSVAKRVQIWLIPTLYEVVSFYSGYSTLVPSTKGKWERYGKEVHHLLVEPNDVIPYLSLFPNVTNLALWTRHDESLLGILEQLPLTGTRFSIPLHDFSDDISDDQNVFEYHPFGDRRSIGSGEGLSSTFKSFYFTDTFMCCVGVE
ncbi:hypothetical protein BDN72DRAFT_207726 [Pluteus cervinus]|uniref:Uncharacterized protein n=1 Tax=Pluteus cervinus TaxID=181527 RepID=A0ACD3AHR4_9AGAR|nr:hypothetical protein BDN72DRAFT_207726 [Pluteus cervinus]